MAQHKIQSSAGLSLELEQVPKMLGMLTRQWAPHSFVVSFKLETDEQILFQKAGAALKNYGVHLVVANLLQTRTDVCYLVKSTGLTKVSTTNAAGLDKERDRMEDQHLLQPDEAQVQVVSPVVKEVVVKGLACQVRVLQREGSETQIEPQLVHYVVQEYCSFLCFSKEQQSFRTQYSACWLSPVKECVKEYVDLITCNIPSHYLVNCNNNVQKNCIFGRLWLVVGSGLVAAMGVGYLKAKRYI